MTNTNSVKMEFNSIVSAGFICKVGYKVFDVIKSMEILTHLKLFEDGSKWTMDMQWLKVKLENIPNRSRTNSIINR